jgi:hypothetical protein
MRDVQWTTVVLDCSDPVRLAAFWAALLGGECTRITDDFHVVRSGSVWLAAARVPDPRPVTWPDGERPKQMHLDIAVGDLDAGVTEALRLGATQEEIQPAPDRWRVMRDPAGHIFCVSDRIQEYLPVDQRLCSVGVAPVGYVDHSHHAGLVVDAVDHPQRTCDEFISSHCNGFRQSLAQGAADG